MIRHILRTGALSLTLFLLPKVFYGQCMSGTYTVGSGGSFLTLKNATDALKTRGICGSLTFSILNGTYSETFSLLSVSGMSSQYFIRFTSQTKDKSKVIINVPASDFGFGIQFQNIPNIQIDHITFRHAGGDGGYVIAMVNCENFVISNNRFEGNLALSSKMLDIGRSFDYVNYLNKGIVNNNEFTQASSSIFIRGIKGAEVYGNRIFNSASGLFVSDIPSSLVAYNYFENTDPTLIQGNGMTFTGDLSNTKVIANQSHILSSTTPGYNFNAAIISATASGGTCYLFNNEFNTADNSHPYGTQINSSSNLSFYNNAFNLGVESGSAGPSYGSTVSSSSSSNIEFYNNVVSNFAKSRALNWANDRTTYKMDYNSFYTNGSTLAIIGLYTAPDLSSVQSSSLQNDHSLQVLPGYISSRDLRIVRNITIDNLGKPNTIVVYDIDSVTRSSTPDIGVNEFTASGAQFDIGLTSDPDFAKSICYGYHPVNLVIKNWGSSTVSKVTLNWSVNQVSQTPYIWTGALSAGATTKVTIGTPYFLNGSYEIGINATLDSGDQNLLDNQLSLLTSVTNVPTISTNKAPSICRTDSVLLSAMTGNIVWSTGSTKNQMTIKDPGNYWYDFTDNRGCISRSDTVAVIVNENIPVLNYKVDQLESTITITNTTTNATQYKWKLGDGNESTAVSPTYSYRTPGNYLIEFYASNAQCQVYSKYNLTIANPFVSSCPPVQSDFLVSSLIKADKKFIAGGATYSTTGAFISKFDPITMKADWRWDYKALQNEETTDLFVDQHNNTFGVIYSDFNDVYFVKLDPGGKQVFVKNFASGAPQYTRPKLKEDPATHQLYLMALKDLSHVQKFDTLGNQIWSSHWPVGSDFHYASYNPIDMTIDHLGNIFAIMFGYPNPNSTASDFILVKFDNQGGLLWELPLQKSTDKKSGLTVRLDSEENAYVFGSSGNSTFITKVEGSGVIKWQYGGSASSDYALSFAIDSEDNLYHLWAYQGIAHLTKLNNSGGLIYNIDVPYSWDNPAGSITFDLFNNVYCTTSEHFSKFSSDGKLLAAKDNGNPIVHASLLLDNGDIILGGYVDSECSLEKIHQTDITAKIELKAQTNSVCHDMPATFQSKVFYADSYTLRWYVNDQLLSGESNASLQVVLIQGDVVRVELVLNPGNCSNNCIISSLPVAIEIKNPVMQIVQSNKTLKASDASNYQWFLNDVAIPGATEQEYVPTVTGNYTVSGDIDMCSVKSEEYNITITEINLDRRLSLYPNPSRGIYYVDIKDQFESYSYVIFSPVTSQILVKGNVSELQNKIDATSLPAGCYVIEFFDTQGASMFVRKVILL